MNEKADGKHSVLFIPIDYWLDRPFLDFLISFILSIIVVLLKLWNVIEIAEHSTFYSAVLSVALGVLSLGTVATTLIVTVPKNENMTKVINNAGDNLIKIMFDCLYILFLSIILCIILFTLDGTTVYVFRYAISCMSITLVFTSALRYLWLLKRILLLLIR